LPSSTFFLFLLSLFPDLHPLKLLFLIFTEIPWPRIRARARATFATTHHRRHHQQWWRILALSPLAVFLSHGLHGLTLSLGYLSLCFLTEALRHIWPEQELELPHRLILTLTEVLDLAKAPSPELELPHGLILTLTEVLDLAKAPSPELELPHGLILTLTEVLDLSKAPSPKLDSHHGHGQELSSSHPLILMAPNLTGLMMAPL
jgi:hypothetical protein